jgi:N-acetylglucosaminyl-diphospho-decaprenol L-rhamnosyltransferase
MADSLTLFDTPHALALLPAPARVDWRPGWTRPPSADPIDVSVCIANWNCRDYLRQCLESLLDVPQGVNLEVIIADNASSDGAVEMIENDFPEVRLIRNSDNLGFSKASNQAADVARGRHLFFLNNDTIVPGMTLSRLVAFADTHPQVGMIGPRLRDGDGKLQLSYRRKPTLKAMLHRTSFLRWTGLFRKAYDHYRRDSFDSNGIRRVEVLMGAAVMMPRHVYQECGGWDEGFRFGVEDVELSDRVGRTRALVHLPGVEITHFGRVSSRQNVNFSVPNLMIGYARYLRKRGTSTLGLYGFKAISTLDAPLQLLGKSLQYAWRKATGAPPARAEKSRLAAVGTWRFLTRELGRFWKA